jgi:hypothetical protein
MQLTKLRAAPELRAEVPPCAPAGRMDGGTASQLIRSVRRLMGKGSPERGGGAWELRPSCATSCSSRSLASFWPRMGSHERCRISSSASYCSRCRRSAQLCSCKGHFITQKARRAPRCDAACESGWGALQRLASCHCLLGDLRSVPASRRARLPCVRSRGTARADSQHRGASCWRQVECGAVAVELRSRDVSGATAQADAADEAQGGTRTAS